MSIEKSIKSFKKDKQRVIGVVNNRYVYSREEAYNLVVKNLSDYIAREKIQLLKGNGNKAYFRKIKEQYRNLVANIVYEEQIKVRDYEDKMDQFIDFVVEEIVGYSVLADAFYNPEVTDIFCNSWNEIFVEKAGSPQPVRYPHTFRSPKHFKAFIDRVLRVDGKEINKGTDKIVDATFYEDRVNAINEPIGAKGPAITFRKHSESHIQLNQLLEQRVMSKELADFLGMLLLGECNLVVGGITGSGKTTTLRGLLDSYIANSGKRMLVVEDTQELFPQAEHNLQLVSFKSDKEEEQIDLEDLIYTALRLKPKYIVVGEVRSRESMAAVESMETGHSTIFTAHAGTPMNLVNRIVTKYLQAMPSLGIDVVERIIGSAIDYVVIQDDIPGIGRKVTSVTEVSYDFETRRVTLKPIYRFNFQTHEFEYLNKISPEKADKMLRRGIPLEVLRQHVEGWNSEDFKL